MDLINLSMWVFVLSLSQKISSFLLKGDFQLLYSIYKLLPSLLLNFETIIK
jgi:hypothetical protein